MTSLTKTSAEAPAVDLDGVLIRLRALGSEHNRAGMARYGINVSRAVGAPVSALRPLARELGKSQELALGLWASGMHEARILAGLVAEPARCDRELLDAWVAQIDSWDLCDQSCNNLFRRTAAAWPAAMDWTRRPEEFTARAGFALLASLSVHDKTRPDADFLTALDRVRQRAGDARNLVRKAVSWALRQIGKRSVGLHGPALILARELAASPDPSARWIGRDAARELDGQKVRARLGL